MAKTSAPRFDCPHCGTGYMLLRVEADEQSEDRDTRCAVCGAPLSGRDGDFVLKYFVTRRSGPPLRERYSIL